MKEYINDKLYPAKVNVLDPSKENYQRHSTIKEILLELSISSDEHNSACFTSEDNNYKVNFIRPPNSCFVSNYFSDGIKDWQANMDIQQFVMNIKLLHICAPTSQNLKISAQQL